jgi:hypothetical protein
MGHQDKGHFAAKHKGRQVDEAVAEQIRAMAKNGSISCAAAHKTSRTLDLPPLEIGVQVDLMELRISECQLGLFGYPGEKKRFDQDIVISDDLDKELETSVTDGRISCSDCWEIAARMKIARLDVGSACEKKNFRIKPCQLGAF